MVNIISTLVLLSCVKAPQVGSPGLKRIRESFIGIEACTSLKQVQAGTHGWNGSQQVTTNANN